MSVRIELENYLYNHIPITKALGIKVEEASFDKVVLFAPFANNINHKQTVFGGSLHSVATLACWSLLYLNLKNQNQNAYQIVIAESHISYLFPVNKDFRAVCLMPQETEWKRFLKILSAKGKGRIQLKARIEHLDHIAVEYQGQFAALRMDL